MRKYRVTINGRNYLINVEGKPQRMGFYKICYLEAHDPQEAENLAVSKIVADPRWRGKILNSADDRPVMYLDSLDELESFEGVESLETGYIFYPDEAAGR
ncbi:MAG TPA: hypothetical protein VFB96_11335 [Pirellulaceae bacterium]|nr:hypothetical protein [Pirellulaceae bacterium]